MERREREKNVVSKPETEKWFQPDKQTLFS